MAFYGFYGSKTGWALGESCSPNGRRGALPLKFCFLLAWAASHKYQVLKLLNCSTFLNFTLLYFSSTLTSFPLIDVFQSFTEFQSLLRLIKAYLLSNMQNSANLPFKVWSVQLSCLHGISVLKWEILVVSKSPDKCELNCQNWNSSQMMALLLLGGWATMRKSQWGDYHHGSWVGHPCLIWETPPIPLL